MTSKEIIQKARAEGRALLTETESKALIRESGIAVTDTQLAHSMSEAVSISNRMGYPVVLKIASKDITHKSDAGGVKVGLMTPEEVEKAYEEIFTSVAQKYPAAALQGVTVQKAARPGVEVIIGMFTDAQFGPVLMFGLGGIWVEILKDVSFRIVPLTKKDVASLIREIKGFPLLEGRRGQKASDIGSLEGALLNLSAFVEKYPEIKEIDLNPIFVYEEGYVAVDARIILSGA
ncbi:MAG: acetate--CoA ligase family protein [Proteobacteria bacterium]|nr:acetate--CoA ligase family protein [Pseudomonadota bacterium]MBU2228341.1 acetate--CoA ligase family protein [Pseudomonadota bacterium]MBU2262530.1 acetate--CoA ligase family protein [Pseudomonadota bacterium]